MARTKRKLPKVGSTAWQLLRLNVGESFTITDFMSVDDATEAKIKNKRIAARNRLASCKKELLEHGKDFTVTVYDHHDVGRQRFVFHAVATMIPLEEEPEDKRKLQRKQKGVNYDDI